MEDILNNFENSLVSQLKQIENSRMLIYNALEAVRKAKVSVQLLPRFTSREDLIRFLIADSDPQELSSTIDSRTLEQTENAIQVQRGRSSIYKIALQPAAQEVPVVTNISPAVSPIPDDNQWSRMKVQVVSSLGNDGTFWCVPCESLPELRRRQNQISEAIKSYIYMAEESLHVATPAVNELVCVFSKSENLWLRAFVEKDLSGGQVQLRYVDTGTQEAFTRSRLSPLPEKLQQLDYVAFYCSLCPSLQRKLPYEAKWKFNDITKGRVTFLTIEDGVELSQKPITRFKLEDGDGIVDIRNEVLKSVEQTSGPKEAFPLPAKDVRNLPPLMTKITLRPQNEDGVKEGDAETSGDEKAESKGDAETSGNEKAVASSDPKTSADDKPVAEGDAETLGDEEPVAEGGTENSTDNKAVAEGGTENSADKKAVADADPKTPSDCKAVVDGDAEATLGQKKDVEPTGRDATVKVSSFVDENSPLVVKRKDSAEISAIMGEGESVALTWGDICTTPGAEEDSENEFVPVFNFPVSDTDEGETADTPNTFNNEQGTMKESKKHTESPGLDSASDGGSENSAYDPHPGSEPSSNAKSNHPERALFQVNKGESRRVRRRRSSHNGAPTDGDGFAGDRLDRGHQRNPRGPTNEPGRTNKRRAQWRYSIKRLGLSSKMYKHQWIELQHKGLSFRQLYEDHARYIVLETTQQRWDYLFRHNDFSPMCDDHRQLEDVLSSFDRQPTFIIFVRYDRRYSDRRISGVGLAVSPLYSDSYMKDNGSVNRVKFDCDILCTAMLWQPWTEKYQDGDVIPTSEGVRIINSITAALQKKEVENSVEYRGDPPIGKLMRREEKGFGSPINLRQPAVRRDNMDTGNQSVPKNLDLERENWDDELPKEQEIIVEKSHFRQKLDFEINTEPFTLKSANAEASRDIKAEMEAFGLSENDVA